MPLFIMPSPKKLAHALCFSPVRTPPPPRACVWCFVSPTSRHRLCDLACAALLHHRSRRPDPPPLPCTTKPAFPPLSHRSGLRKPPGALPPFLPCRALPSTSESTAASPSSPLPHFCHSRCRKSLSPHHISWMRHRHHR
jgi:hypothetical protein